MKLVVTAAVLLCAEERATMVATAVAATVGKAASLHVVKGCQVGPLVVDYSSIAFHPRKQNFQVV